MVTLFVIIVIIILLLLVFSIIIFIVFCLTRTFLGSDSMFGMEMAGDMAYTNKREKKRKKKHRKKMCLCVMELWGWKNSVHLGNYPLLICDMKSVCWVKLPGFPCFLFLVSFFGCCWKGIIPNGKCLARGLLSIMFWPSLILLHYFILSPRG